MQVQVNTGNGVQNKESLERWATEFLNDELARFRQELTRVEVQLNDENRGKGGADDMRCMLEARLNGHEPVAVPPWTRRYGARPASWCAPSNTSWASSIASIAIARASASRRACWLTTLGGSRAARRAAGAGADRPLIRVNIFNLT